MPAVYSLYLRRTIALAHADRHIAFSSIQGRITAVQLLAEVTSGDAGCGYERVDVLIFGYCGSLLDSRPST
jgi:hypothetical protein